MWARCAMSVGVASRWAAMGLLAVSLCWVTATTTALAQSPAKHMTAQNLGLLINMADPYSVAVGEYYAERRGIPQEHVLRVILPVRPTLTEAEFETLTAQVREHMGAQVQGLALAWTQPYAVDCNSITSALGQGFQPDICKQTCGPAIASRYFNSTSSQPFTRYGVRPSMLLASRSVASAKRMIDRGMASDHQLGKLGGPPASAVFVSTADKARNVRAALFPPAGAVPGRVTQVVRMDTSGHAAEMHDDAARRVVLYQTGLALVDDLNRIDWLPGALADHLTSFGGRLLDSQGQTSALDWLEAGATASYGTVSEPCNHSQKFPHPQLLLAHYLRGASALEAYWRSVAWPAQGVFIGEPLAAPYAR
jgi:uncharacterized protein (TIGR03790 family)